jgi:hypothetical protein
MDMNEISRKDAKGTANGHEWTRIQSERRKRPTADVRREAVWTRFTWIGGRQWSAASLPPRPSLRRDRFLRQLKFFRFSGPFRGLAFVVFLSDVSDRDSHNGLCQTRTPPSPSLWRGKLRMDTKETPSSPGTPTAQKDRKQNSRNRRRQGYVGQERTQRSKRGYYCRGSWHVALGPMDEALGIVDQNCVPFF